MAPPLRKCLHPSCRKLIPFDERYCEQHSKTVNQEYDQARKRNNPKYIKFYRTTAWKSVRKVALLRDDGLCQLCLVDGIITEAQMVDHIIPVLVDWEKRLELNNLQSLCYSCHARKTSDDKKIFN